MIRVIKLLTLFTAAVLSVTILPARTLFAQGGGAAVVRSATAVLQEIQSMPGRSIPQGMLARAKAVAIIPNVIKIGFIGAIRRGSGVAVVRNANGTWGNPIFITLTGGGVGFQAGLQATDVVLVFNSPESVAGMLNGKFTLGADAAVAAGPVGRQAAAATDIQFRAAILSYSRSRGLFAGVSLDGSVISVDHNTNAAFYHVVGGTPQAIIAGQGIPVPPGVAELKAVLTAQSGAPPAATVTPAEMTSSAQPTPAQPGPTVAQPQLVAPAASPSKGPAPSSAASLDQLRRELADASKRLGARLDQPWRDYLALPSSVYGPGDASPTPQGLKVSLDRFELAGSDAKYQAVQNMPEFQLTLGILRKYYTALTHPPATPGPVTLPPPPAVPQTSAQPSAVR